MKLGDTIAVMDGGRLLQVASPAEILGKPAAGVVEQLVDVFLRDLQDINETLYFAVITRYTEELLPKIYTPTVGAGCQQFHHIYRRPRGLFISYPNRAKMDEILANPRYDNVECIVVTDDGCVSMNNQPHELVVVPVS